MRPYLSLLVCRKRKLATQTAHPSEFAVLATDADEMARRDLVGDARIYCRRSQLIAQRQVERNDRAKSLCDPLMGPPNQRMGALRVRARMFYREQLVARPSANVDFVAKLVGPNTSSYRTLAHRRAHYGPNERP